MNVRRNVPATKALYSKLEEPPFIRLSHFLIYASTTVAGLVATLTMPVLLIHMIGPTMVMVFGIFAVAGSLIAIAGVVIKHGWLEQMGIILLFTAVVMYIVMLIYSSVTVIALWIAAALAISLVQRWMGIRYATQG